MEFIKVYVFIGWVVLLFHFLTLMQGEEYLRILQEEARKVKENNNNSEVAVVLFSIFVTIFTFLGYTFLWPAIVYDPLRE